MAFVPPIVSPSIPFVGPIPGGRLVEGCMITIQGKAHHHHHKGFGINLSTQPRWDQLGDTPLHFNVRFNENCVVRNTLQGSWGMEERGGGNPVHKGQLFEIIILVKNHHYKIAVNGKHFCEFRHRMAKESVQYLIISGEVEINFIKFGNEHEKGHHHHHHPHQEGGLGTLIGGFVGAVAGAAIAGVAHAKQKAGGAAPPPMPAGSYPSGGYPSGGQAPIYNPAVPFTLPIPGGLTPGRMIYLSGIPSGIAQRFSVYLHVGQYPGGDVAMVFDSRFNFGNDHNTTVRNHRVANNWGSEERHQSYFPFTPNANFDMIILADQTAFKVAVNNQHYVEFPYRIQPVSQVGCMMVDGDVRLTQVRLQ